MAGGVTLSVRQISSYALLTSASPGDLLLTQPGGLGNPYASVDAATLVSTVLASAAGPSLGVGYPLPADATSEQVFTGQLVMPAGGNISWNGYSNGTSDVPWQPGAIGNLTWNQVDGFRFSLGTPTNPTVYTEQWQLKPSGNMNLPYGTLSVARDPGAALEVATMGWVGNNTVASFNGRKGVVRLTSADIYNALCLDSCIATENWVNSAIQGSIQLLLSSHPFVFGWNGRTGAVYLTLADITCVFFQPGQQPVTQTPPLTSNDYSIPNTAWVVEYIANEFAGGGGNLATQSWVLANTVNSFNGRMGVVTLTTADVIDVGAAPLNSPAFSGIPTAPTAAVGQATGQIATTAFVQQAITNNTAGVSTFNTRTGDVTLETADLIAAGGITNPSANLTGNPTAPTQPPGTNLPVIATCEFVQAALASGAVTSFNTRTGAVTLTLADITGVGGAPLVSPAFSSVPTAPTAAPGTNTVQLATTAFVTAAVTAAGGVSSFNSRTGAVDLIANDISAAGGLVNPSVGLTGSPTATTATAGDNSTRIATTAFVATALSTSAVSSFNTRTGAVTLQGADITGAGGALLASPAFTGTPTAPTATAGTNNTQIATTAYVTAAILADTTGVTSFNTRTGAISLLLADITGAGGAPLASPSFTGVPLGPTATAGTSTTQLATTAFVQAAIASSGVSSFNSRTGAVTLIANDISAAGGAVLASPVFTGTPQAPTPTAGDNSANIATTAFVAAALGGYLPLTGGTLTGPLTGTQFNVGNNGSITSPATGAIQLAAVGGNRLVIGPTNPIFQFVNATGSTLFSSNSVGNWSLDQLNVGSSAWAAGSFAALQAGSATAPGGAFSNGSTVAGGTALVCRVDLNFNYMTLYYFGNTAVGSISTNGSSVTYNTTSDGRLKENVAALDEDYAGATIDALAPVSFNWISNPDLGTDYGFIAQDVESVFPQAVSRGIGDLGDENFLPWGMDNSKLVPLLVAELKALRGRVAALEAR